MSTDRNSKKVQKIHTGTFSSVKPLNNFMVRERGLEPPRPKTLVPETSASTNSATRAFGGQKTD
jgi:hypothetical protein